MKNEKLVRDRIPEFSEAARDGRVFRHATEVEMPVLLARKLIEEAREASDELVVDVPNLVKVIEEIGDVLDVVDAISQHFRILPEAILAARRQKSEKKGTFDSWIVLDLDTNIDRP